MAGKKNARSSKTDHVLSLLTDSSPEPAGSGTPPAPEPQPVETVSAPVPERHLTPPILEVARTNNEALEETIHSALEDALKEELAQEEAAAPPPQPEVPDIEPPSPGPEAPSDTRETTSAEVPAEQEAPAAAEAVSAAGHEVPPSAEEELPSAPEKVPTAQEEIPAQDPTVQASAGKSAGQSLPYYCSLPDGNRFVNVMLPLVEETLERYVTLFHLCDCPRCLADAQALALSRLPAKYVVLSEDAFTPMMSLYRAKYDSQVTTQVIYACKQVMDAPRH